MPTRVLCLGVLAAALFAQPTPPLRSWAEAEKLESDLASRTDDVDGRVQLLRFYQAQQADRARPLRNKLLR
jgi:hypothetical protein